MHCVAKAADVPAMARARAAVMLLGTGLLFLLPAHATVALTPVTSPVTLPTTLPTVPVTVPSLEGLTTIPVLADPPSIVSVPSEPARAPSNAPTSPPTRSDAIPAPGTSADGDGDVATPASRSREVPLSFTSAARKAGPPFALPILVIVALSAYQLARAARDRRDHRLAAAVAEEQWIPFR
jgi:hypothetical protein